ncbi:MAG TPA: class I SAM-dependent methyltransferase [Candidatus Dormibacteraeota bacterium]
MADEGTFSCFSVGSIAGTYEEIYVPRIFVPWAGLLLERAALRPGEAVLDIATGPGTVARIAAEQVGPQGRVVGADFSEAMIAIARTKAPVASAAKIEYVVSPAAPLAVDDAAFDVVTCQQGLQFFPDRAAAVREMRRALKPGGRVVAAVWREIALQPSFAVLDAALRECLPADQAEPYGAPFRWPSASALKNAFTDHGFIGVSVTELRHPLTYEGGIAQVIATLAASPIAGTIAGLDADTGSRLRSAAARHLTPLLADGQVRTQMVSNLLTATKPNGL